MKHPRFLYTVLALLGVGALIAATVPQLNTPKTPLDDLRDRSNRMERREFLDYALTEQDSLIRTISSHEWVAGMGMHAGVRGQNPLPDSIVYRCTPTLYDLVVIERLGWWDNQRDSLLSAWSAFHAADTDPLTRYYISYYRGEDALQAYNATPDTWERGLLLLHPLDTLYQIQKSHIAKYTNSPFAPTLRNIITQTEQQSAHLSTSSMIRSTDSVRLTLNVRNANRVQIEIFELPNGKKAEPKNLRLYRQHPVSIDGTIPFNRVQHSVVLPPLPIGDYYIYPYLPDEKQALKLQDKNSHIYVASHVQVSDIRTFSHTAADQVRGEIIVVDAQSGEPISDFKTTFEKYRGYTVARGRDQQSSTYPSAPSREGTCELCIFPSSPIYRAGDTAQISMVLMHVQPSGRKVMADRKLKVSINEPNWKALLDTTLVTDEDGVATISLPFSDDMRRGTYRLNAVFSDKAIKLSAYGNAHIDLADYRMPTAELHLEKPVCDSLVHIHGTVLRTTGLPVPNLQIEGEVNGYASDTFTIQTDAEGRFAYTLSRTKSDSVLHHWATVRVSATLQGEYLEASTWIGMRPIPRTIEQKDTVPADVAFILPRQDFHVEKDGSAQLHILSAADLPLYILASSRNQVEQKRWTHISKGDNVLSFQVPTAKDEYLDITLVSYLNGKRTIEAKKLFSPNRYELHIVPEVMRDYLVPGTTEKWQLRLTNQQGEPQKGRMILALNNIGLSSLAHLPWRQSLPSAWSNDFTEIYAPYHWNSSGNARVKSISYWSFPSLPLFELSGRQVLEQKVMIRGMASGVANSKALSYSAPVEVLGITDDAAYEMEEEYVETGMAESPSPDFSSVQTRMTDTSVGLYRHDLISGQDSRISLSFRTPMDNTSWLLQAVAWTRDGATGDWTDTLVAKREVMVHLSQPRFLRLGDEATLQAIVTNAADRTQSIDLLLEVFDPATNRNLYKVEKRVKLARNEERNITLSVHIDPAWCHATDLDTPAPLAVRIRAIGQNGASDGEQRTLPILNICAPVREAQPFCTRDSVITLTLPARPKGATNEQVELTYCTSPIPTVLSGLDIEEDTTLVSATAVMHNLYALAIRNRLAETYPEIFNGSMSQSMVNGKWSNGQYNLAPMERRLCRFQRASGAFAWLDDSRARDCYYTTLHIVSLMEELDDADALPAELRTSFTRAKAWLALQKEYRTYQHNLDSLSRVLPTSRLSEWPYWALRKERQGKHEEAKTIVQALRRYNTVDAEKGMYWANIPDYWWWMRTSDIEATFLLAFSRIDPEEEELAQMRQWLILNHHTNRWGKSSLAAYCAYALMQGLSREEVVAMDTTTYRISLPVGTTTYTLHLNQTPCIDTLVPQRGKGAEGGKGASIGALSVSYQAPLSDIREHGTKALRIRRDYLLRGKTVNNRTKLHSGDRVTVRLTIESDREYDNLTLTDRRAALLEPTETLSGYGWQDALYYREVRDQRITFYLTHLRKGKTVLTYDCILSTDGTSRSGLSDIVSDLAPEYTAHTATEEIIVK